MMHMLWHRLPDPALDALRELTDKPVVGIAESALHFASFLGYKFAVINTLPRIRANL